MSLGEGGLGIWDNLEAYSREEKGVYRPKEPGGFRIHHGCMLLVLMRKLEAVMCFHTYYMYMLIGNHMLLLQ